MFYGWIWVKELKGLVGEFVIKEDFEGSFECFGERREI